MKNFLLLLTIVGSMNLIAGAAESHSYSIVPTEEPETGKPFGGKQWEKAYIASDHSVYTLYKNGWVKKWNFEGQEKANSGYNSTDPHKKARHTYFTDDNCYREYDNTVVRYPMNVGSKVVTTMTHNIKRFAVSEAGFATLTKDGFVTKFDSESHLVGNPIKIADNVAIGLLDSGELFNIDASQVTTITNPNTKKTANITTLGILPKRFVRKKTSNGQIVLVFTDPRKENTGIIKLVNLENGQTKQLLSSISPLPKQLDVDGDHLAIGGNHRGAVKVFDINTGKETYKGNSKGIHGKCALRLDGNEVYLLGVKPQPGSITIDTREKSKEEKS